MASDNEQRIAMLERDVYHLGDSLEKLESAIDRLSTSVSKVSSPNIASWAGWGSVLLALMIFYTELVTKPIVDDVRHLERLVIDESAHRKTR